MFDTRVRRWPDTRWRTWTLLQGIAQFLFTRNRRLFNMRRTVRADGTGQVLEVLSVDSFPSWSCKVWRGKFQPHSVIALAVLLGSTTSSSTYHQVLQSSGYALFGSSAWEQVITGSVLLSPIESEIAQITHFEQIYSTKAPGFWCGRSISVIN